MVIVDRNKCIGCGACSSICDKVFEMKEGKAQVKKGQEKTTLPCAKEAAESCPVEAIKL
ncbi:MAG: ferredoxin [Nanoarchaeota archaeon]|nr:ferredoxin [Nanoarchaeota archaeon]